MANRGSSLADGTTMIWHQHYRRSRSPRRLVRASKSTGYLPRKRPNVGQFRSVIVWRKVQKLSESEGHKRGYYLRTVSVVLGVAVMTWGLLLGYLVILVGAGLHSLIGEAANRPRPLPWWSSHRGLGLVIGAILLGQLALSGLLVGRFVPRVARRSARWLAAGLALLLGVAPVVTLTTLLTRKAKLDQAQLQSLYDLRQEEERQRQLLREREEQERQLRYREEVARQEQPEKQRRQELEAKLKKALQEAHREQRKRRGSK